MEQLVLELAPPPEPTLGNFHSTGNAAALAAVQALMESGGVLFLWGQAGCGKTHLLRAAASAAQARGTPAQYRGAGDQAPIAQAQFIAVDDVGSLPDAVQAALFDAFNRMRPPGGAILAAGSLPPADLTLREDLRTRLGSGVVMQLRPLSEEEKRAVLTEHAARRGLALSPAIIDNLIARSARDLGSLIALVEALDRYSLRAKRAITLPLLRELMRAGSDE